MPVHVSRERFAELVEQAVADLPEPFAGFLEEVPIEIKLRPSRRLLRSMDMEDHELLFGLYQGASLLDKVEIEGRGSPMPNHILIFQEDHELACESVAELVAEVRTTVLHENGHHFGMDEDDLEKLGYR